MLPTQIQKLHMHTGVCLHIPQVEGIWGESHCYLYFPSNFFLLWKVNTACENCRANWVWLTDVTDEETEVQSHAANSWGSWTWSTWLSGQHSFLHTLIQVQVWLPGRGQSTVYGNACSGGYTVLRPSSDSGTLFHQQRRTRLHVHEEVKMWGWCSNPASTWPGLSMRRRVQVGDALRVMLFFWEWSRDILPWDGTRGSEWTRERRISFKPNLKLHLPGWNLF